MTNASHELIIPNPLILRFSDNGTVSLISVRPYDVFQCVVSDNIAAYTDAVFIVFFNESVEIVSETRAPNGYKSRLLFIGFSCCISINVELDGPVGFELAATYSFIV